MSELLPLEQAKVGDKDKRRKHGPVSVEPMETCDTPSPVLSLGHCPPSSSGEGRGLSSSLCPFLPHPQLLCQWVPFWPSWWSQGIKKKKKDTFYHLFSSRFSLKKKKNIYLFIFGWVGSSLLCMGFSLVAASGGYSSLRCAGFSLQWLLLLWSTGSRHTGPSVVVARGL